MSILQRALMVCRVQGYSCIWWRRFSTICSSSFSSCSTVMSSSSSISSSCSTSVNQSKENVGLPMWFAKPESHADYETISNNMALLFSAEEVAAKADAKSFLNRSYGTVTTHHQNNGEILLDGRQVELLSTFEKKAIVNASSEYNVKRRNLEASPLSLASNITRNPYNDIEKLASWFFIDHAVDLAVTILKVHGANYLPKVLTVLSSRNVKQRKPKLIHLSRLLSVSGVTEAILSFSVYDIEVILRSMQNVSLYAPEFQIGLLNAVTPTMWTSCHINQLSAIVTTAQRTIFEELRRSEWQDDIPVTRRWTRHQTDISTDRDSSLPVWVEVVKAKTLLDVPIISDIILPRILEEASAIRRALLPGCLYALTTLLDNGYCSSSSSSSSSSSDGGVPASLFQKMEVSFLPYIHMRDEHELIETLHAYCKAAVAGSVERNAPAAILESLWSLRHSKRWDCIPISVIARCLVNVLVIPDTLCLSGRCMPDMPAGVSLTRDFLSSLAQRFKKASEHRVQLPQSDTFFMAHVITMLGYAAILPADVIYWILYDAWLPRRFWSDPASTTNLLHMLACVRVCAASAGEPLADAGHLANGNHLLCQDVNATRSVVLALAEETAKRLNGISDTDIRLDEGLGEASQMRDYRHVRINWSAGNAAMTLWALVVTDDVVGGVIAAAPSGILDDLLSLLALSASCGDLVNDLSPASAQGLLVLDMAFRNNILSVKGFKVPTEVIEVCKDVLKSAIIESEPSHNIPYRSGVTESLTMLGLNIIPDHALNSLGGLVVDAAVVPGYSDGCDDELMEAVTPQIREYSEAGRLVLWLPDVYEQSSVIHAGARLWELNILRRIGVAVAYYPQSQWSHNENNIHSNALNIAIILQQAIDSIPSDGN